MTYLETLIRILPRQRRAAITARAHGTGMALTGALIAVPPSIAVAVNGPSSGAIFGMVGGAALLLNGMYRAVQSDLHVRDLTAQMDGVAAAIDDESAKGRLVRTFPGVKDFYDELHRSNR